MSTEPKSFLSLNISTTFLDTNQNFSLYKILPYKIPYLIPFN